MLCEGVSATCQSCTLDCSSTCSLEERGRGGSALTLSAAVDSRGTCTGIAVQVCFTIFLMRQFRAFSVGNRRRLEKPNPQQLRCFLYENVLQRKQPEAWGASALPAPAATAAAAAVPLGWSCRWPLATEAAPGAAAWPLRCWPARAFAWSRSRPCNKMMLRKNSSIAVISLAMKKVHCKHERLLEH